MLGAAPHCLSLRRHLKALLSSDRPPAGDEWGFEVEPGDRRQCYRGRADEEKEERARQDRMRVETQARDERRKGGKADDGDGVVEEVEAVGNGAEKAQHWGFED